MAKGDGHRGHKVRVNFTLWRKEREVHGAGSPQAYNAYQRFLAAQAGAVHDDKSIAAVEERS